MFSQKCIVLHNKILSCRCYFPSSETPTCSVVAIYLLKLAPIAHLHRMLNNQFILAVHLDTIRLLRPAMVM